MNDKIKVLDLFGGIGGFRLGLEKASDRFEIVEYVEKDEYAVKSYNNIFGENHDTKDATELKAEELPDFDVLCAGFPCQSFSIAGKRGGFEDTRGTLFFEIARIAKRKLPKILLLENVKGLLNHANGKTFNTILQTLHELGYSIEWQVLNSKYHGVPQNRERVFIIGHLGEKPERKIFPFRREDERDSGENGGIRELNAEGLNVTGDGASYCIDSNYFKGTSPGDIGSGRRTQIIDWSIYQPKVINHQMRPEDRPSIQKENQSGGSGLLYNSEYSYTISKSPHYLTSTEPIGIDDYNGNLTGDQVGAVRQTCASSAPRNGVKLAEVQLPENLVLDDTQDFGESGSRVYEDFTPTLRSERHGLKLANSFGTRVRVRRLTPRECWRLQGFPDWAFDRAKGAGISDTQLYKQAGNAVTVNVIHDIGERLVQIFPEKENNARCKSTMKNSTYVVFDISTGDTRTRKTKPKKDKVKPTEVVLKAELSPVEYTEESEETEPEVVEDSDKDEATEESDDSNVILGSDEDE